jgi:hypothetical protein
MWKATRRLSDVPMFVQRTEAMLEEIYRLMLFSAHLDLLLLKMVGWNGINVLISSGEVETALVVLLKSEFFYF